MHCGTKIEVDNSTIECPSCHARIPKDSKFCPDCGGKIELSIQDNGKNQTFIVQDITFKMIYVECGEFLMGAPEEKILAEKSKPAHKVQLTHNYYIGETPVTQALWRKVMNGNNSFHGDDGIGKSGTYGDEWEELPVEGVS